MCRRKYIVSEKDIEFIKLNHNKLSKRSIMKEINIPINHLNKILDELGLNKPKRINKPKLSEEDIEYIKNNYKKKSAQKIADNLGYKVSTVYSYIKKYRKKSFNHWTDVENNILIENYWKNDILYIKKKLKEIGSNRSKIAIEAQVRKLHLLKDVSHNGTYFLSKDIVDLIGINYSTLANLYKTNKLKSSITSGKRRVSYEDLVTFLRTYPNKWSTVNADIRTLKGMFSNTFINPTGNIDVIEIEDWLLEKIEKDKKVKKTRGWTVKEVNLLFKLREENYTFKEIAVILDKTISSVSSKVSDTKRKGQIV